MKKWKTISTRAVADFRINEIELPTGKKTDYITINYPSSVGIIALTKEDKVVMVGQYRYAVDEYSWEIPAGTIEDESVEQAANRELREETGFVAAKIERICSFHPSNAASSQVIHLCLAKGVTKDTKSSMCNEPVEELLKVQLFELVAAMDMVQKSEIKDAATIIGLLFLMNERRGAKDTAGSL